MDHRQRRAVEKVIDTVTDGNVLALAAFLGVLASFGLGLHFLVGVVTALGTVAGAAAVNALPQLSRGDQLERPERPQLLPRTQQAQLVAQIEGGLTRIRQLRDDADTADSVKDAAAQAFSAADSAVTTAHTVAAGVDELDAAMRDLQSVHSAAASLERLQQRRVLMLDRLSRTLAGVLDVYGKLVETDATVKTSSIVEAGDQQQLAQIGTSLDDLRRIVGELESDTGDGTALTN